MLVGYARVSMDDQNLALQTRALKEIGCTKIYEDKISGTKTNRPGLMLALEVLRKDDTLVVWKLDRLGRTVKGLIDLINQLNRIPPIIPRPPLTLRCIKRAQHFLTKFNLCACKTF